MTTLLTVACDANPPAEPEPSLPTVSIILTLSDSSLHPGSASEITTTATVTGGRLASHGITIGGLFDTTLAFPVTDPMSQTIVISLQVPRGPIEGTLTFVAFARATATTGSAVDSASGRIVISDDGPPRVSMSLRSFRIPGDTLLVYTVAEDAAGITAWKLQVTGAFEMSESHFYQLPPSVYYNPLVLVPGSARMGDSAAVVLTVRDSFDKQTTVQRTLHIQDTVPPVVTSSLRLKDYDYWNPLSPAMPTLFAGDTARVVVRASDNHKLSWIGYRFQSGGDSLQVDTPGDSAEFSFPAPRGQNTLATLVPFARDSSNSQNQGGYYVDVVDAAWRPIRSVSPFRHASNMHRHRYVYDAKRDVLFILDDSGIAPLALDPPRYSALIPISGIMVSLDLTRSGDSLVVLVHRGSASFMDVVDLTREPWAADTIRLTAAGALYGFDLRVDAHNRALVTVSDFFLNPAHHLLEVNLATRGQRLLPVPAWPLALTRSGDGSLIVAMGARGMATYDIAADRSSPVNPMPELTLTDPDYLGWPGVDDAGTQLLFATRLYDRTLTSSRVLPVACQLNNVVRSLSADGQWAYLAERDGCIRTGYQKVHTGTGQIAETVYLPFNPYRLVPLPDGQRLLVAAENWLGVVDLR